jgi:hypothetical protein
MSLVRATPLTQVRELAHPDAVWRQAADIMARLAQHGLVHCDFNEFNLLVDDDEARNTHTRACALHCSASLCTHPCTLASAYTRLFLSLSADLDAD